MRLLKLYEAVLAFCSMEPGDGGKIDVVSNGSRKPAMIDDQRLAMPTMENLRADPDEKLIIFHPLREYIDRGESVVVRKLKHHVNVRLNFAVYALASELFRVIADTAKHDRLTPEQRELLLQVRGVDATTEKRFMEYVLKKYKGMETRYFTNIYLKKSGTYRGEKHARVGVVSFPFYELLDDESVKTSRVSDRDTFRQMLEFIFPGSKNDKEEWNSFSDSRNAPWLECLLKTSLKLAERINELSHMYKDFLADREDFLFDTSWADAIDNLDAYQSEISSIPTQRGNEGTVAQGEKEGAAIERKQDTLPVRQDDRPSQTSTTTMQLPQSVAQRGQTSTGMSPPTPRATVPVRGQQQYQQQHHGHYAPPPPPEPMSAVLPDGTLDLDVVLATNPQVASGMYAPTPLTAWHQSQQQQRHGYPAHPGYGQQPQGGYYDPRGAYIGPHPGAAYGPAPGAGYPPPVAGRWAAPAPQYGVYGGPPTHGGYPGRGSPYIAPI